jgi:hypothetical protein
MKMKRKHKKKPKPELTLMEQQEKKDKLAAQKRANRLNEDEATLVLKGRKQIQNENLTSDDKKPQSNET